MRGKLGERLEEEMSRRSFLGLGVAGISAAMLLASGCANGEEDDDDDEGGEEDDD